MRHITLALASVLLLAVTSQAEDEASWAARPAVKIGDRVLTRANIGRRLVHSFGLGLMRGRLHHEQLVQALATKGLSVEPADVESKRKAVLADFEKRGRVLDDELRKSHRTIKDFERDVWGLAATEVLARKVGIRPAEIAGYLALNIPVRGSDDPDDPILARVGEKEIPLRPMVEVLLPLVDADARNRLLDGVLVGEAVERALEGEIVEPTAADIKKLEDEARAKILKASRGQRTLEMVLNSQKRTLASYRQALRHGERIHRAILAETTEADLRQHFDRWLVYFEGQRVRVSHILVRCGGDAGTPAESAARAKCDALRKRIDGGEAFATVALEASDDAGSRLRGGDLNFIPRKSPLIAEEFASAAFALEKGELSGPVRTRHGFHLILAVDRMQGRTVTFEEIRVEVERDYATSHTLAWVDEARKGLTLEILWDALKVQVKPGKKDE